MGQEQREGQGAISRRGLLGWLGAAAAGAALAACGQPSASAPAAGAPAAAGGAAPASKPAAAPTAAPSPARFRLGITNYAFDSGFTFMAGEKGFLKDANIDLEITRFEGDPIILRALLAGEIDIAEMSPGGTLISVSRGNPLRLIGGFITGLPHQMYVRREINRVADLRGKTIGISAPGSLPHILNTVVLERAGVDPQSVNWVNVGGAPAVFQAVLGGKIDAGLSFAEYSRQIKPGDDVKVLLTYRTEVPEYVRGAYIVNERVIQERAEPLQRLVNAMARGFRYANEQPQETIDLAIKLIGGERDNYDWTFGYYREQGLLDFNFHIAPERIAFMQQLNQQLGLQDTAVPIERVYDGRFSQGVVQALGSYQPA